MTDATHRAAVAERAARAGGVVARDAFREDIPVETKGGKNDVVTAADRDAQAQVVATVRREFPEDAFLLEETVQTPTGPDGGGEPTEVDAVAEAGTVWVVDPIDGTANFVRGNPTWTTSVAAVSDGDTQAAATFLPAQGDLYAAGPESVTRNDASMAVSERTDPETFAVAAVGWWDRDERDAFGDLCRRLATDFGDVRRIGSFQATLAQVADGGLEAAVCTQPTHPWDTIAGVHLIRRAGGTVTDIAGKRWTPDAEGLVASNGVAHEALVDVAATVQDA